MASNVVRPSPAAQREWFIAGRWEEYEGEGRANLLRLIGLTVFYSVELLNFYGLNLGFLVWPQEVERPFHIAVTLLTLGWAMLCAAVLYCRRQGIFPRSLKFVSTGGDLLLSTSILTLADGPRSPLVVVYFLIIVLAALRFSLPLVWWATGGAVVGYLFLLGFARWGEIPGWPRSDMVVPRYAQCIFLLALILTGVVVGQVVRGVRRLAENYALLVAQARGGSP
jgi:hypothetical protein